MAASANGEREDQNLVALSGSRSLAESETEPQQTLREEHSNLPVDRGWAWMVLFGKSVITST